MKQEYCVEVIETLRKVIRIEAESGRDAVDIVREKYHEAEDPKYILTSENYLETEFNLVDPNHDFDILPITFEQE